MQRMRTFKITSVFAVEILGKIKTIIPKKVK
jgi:hypothetical protein